MPKSSAKLPILDTTQDGDWLTSSLAYDAERELFERLFGTPSKGRALKEAIATGLAQTLKGGAGSGNFSHAGRPGKVGGSAPNKGAAVGETPAAFHGDREKYLAARQEYLGEKPWLWMRSAEHMEGQLSRKPGDQEYAEEFSIDSLYEKYRPQQNKVTTDWDAWERDYQANKSKWTINREEYEAVYKEVRAAYEQRMNGLRKKLGLPDTVDGLLGPEVFNPEADHWDGKDPEVFRRLYGRAHEIGRDIINKVDLNDYSASELRYGLFEKYHKDLEQRFPDENDPRRRAASSWVWNMDSAVGDAGQFETMHKLSTGEWAGEDSGYEEHGFRADAGPDQFKPLPADLYHVTTAAGAIEQSGIKSRYELGISSGPGLGGGSDQTVSFSTDLKTAIEIERSMHEAQLVASGEITAHDLLTWARDGKGKVGKNWAYSATHDLTDNPTASDYDPLTAKDTSYTVKDLLAYERGADVFDYSGKAWDHDKYMDALWHYYAGTYMWAREHLGGFFNPLFFSTDYKKLANMDPKQFKTLHFKPATKKARGWQMSSLAEWRITGSDVVKLVEAKNFFDPSDPDFWEKIIG